MIKKASILTILMMFLAAGTIGQPFSVVKDIDILEDKYLVLEMDYPHMIDTLSIIEIYQVDEKHARILYSKDGIYCEAIVNRDRKDMILVATAVAIPGDQVPDIVMDVFREGDYGSWNIDNTLAMRTPYGPWFYAIDVSKDDTYLRLFYDDTGNYKKSPY